MRVARALGAPPVGDDAEPRLRLKDLILERGCIRILLSHQEIVSTERLLAEGWAEAKDTGTVKNTIQRLRNAHGLAGDP